MQFIDKFVVPLKLKFWIHPFYMYLYLLNIVLSISLSKGSEYFFQHFILHIHHTAVTLMLSTLNINKRNIPPLTLSSLSPQLPEPVASWGSPSIKATAQHDKTTDFSSLQNQPAITLCLGQQTLWWGTAPEPPIEHTHSDKDIQTIQIHIWSVFVPILQSWKSRHSQDTPGTVFCKQASQRRHCSVIISTMTVWVYTSAILVNVYCLVKLPVCSCVSLVYITDHNAVVGFCLSVRGTRLLSWIRGELGKYLLYLWSRF